MDRAKREHKGRLASTESYVYQSICSSLTEEQNQEQNQDKGQVKGGGGGGGRSLLQLAPWQHPDGAAS